jgi:predicted nucleic acid-binding protein
VAGRGRPPNPRAVISTEDADVPSEITLDTSFVFEGLSPTEDDFEPCSLFLDRLAEQGSVLYFNRLLEIELRESALRAALKERWSGKWRDKLTDMRAMRRARPLVEETMGAWDEALTSIATVRVDLSDVEDRVSFLMLNYGLHSYDAVHVATALHVNVPAIATRDSDFGALPSESLTIYTPPGRLKTIRSARGGRFKRFLREKF